MNENLYRLIFDLTNDAFFIHDVEGRFLEVSTAAAERLGYSRAELMKMSLKDIDAPVELDEIPRRMAKLRQNARSIFETVHVRRDGTVLPVEVSARMIEYHGRPAVLSVARDISSRRQAEVALRESEARFRVAFEDGANPKCLTHTDGRFLAVNRAFCELIGFEEEELRDRRFAEFTHPDDVDKSVELVRLLLERPGEARRIEKRYIHRSGRIIWADLSSVLFQDHDGRPLYFIAEIVDISDRKRAEEERARVEEQLRHSQRMEAIGRLAGGIAHDFNNLLMVILQGGQLVQKTLAPGHPALQDLVEVEKAAKRAAGLTQQLLAFSRKSVTQPTSLSLNLIVADMERMFRRILGEDIEIGIRLAPGLAPVWIDQSHLEQLLANLVVNARDAMPHGGKLTLETRNVEIGEAEAEACSVRRPGRFVLLAVSDNGEGMAQEVKEHIFEPFYTTKKRGEGTGLGLATVYGIVKQVDGFIWVYSEVGVGTTFKIYFPRSEEEQLQPKPAPSPGRVLHTGALVLLVEDDPAVRNITPRVLERLGFQVIVAQDGKDALAKFKQVADKVHVVLTDVVMPGMSGKVLVERLRAVRPSLPVVFMSGYTDDAIAHHGVLDEGVLFVQKPFDLDELIDKLQRALG